MEKFPPMWEDGLPSEFSKKAEAEIGETPEVKKEALKDLRKLISSEQGFRPKRDDDFLLRFLRAKKYDVKAAFKTMRKYYSYKAKYSRIATDFKPSELMNVLEQNCVDIMPVRRKDGTAIAIVKLGAMDLRTYKPEDLLAACLMTTELGIKHEMTQVCGGCLIFDLKGVSLGMMYQYGSPRFLFRFASVIQNCLPIRIHSIHAVNQPLYFNVLFNVFKHFLSEKMRSRLHLHGSNFKSLHKFFPSELLPEKYGGKRGPMDNSELMQRLLADENYFVEMNKYGYSEKQVKLLKRMSSRGIATLA